jgi:topoisomerase-4 subunit A
MKPEDNSTILQPIKLDERTHIAVISSESKLLIFPLSEVNEYPNGGKGVRIMDIPDNASLSRIELSNGQSANIVVKGKIKVIEGDDLAKYLLKRARKGHAILDSKPVVRKQAGLF